MVQKDIIKVAGKKFIRLSTFAADMDLHIRTVQLWAKNHDMPVVRVGNQMLLDLDDLPEWLDRHKSKPVGSAGSQSAPSASVSSLLGDTVSPHQA
jgi:excisionase family DNA binding protein